MAIRLRSLFFLEFRGQSTPAWLLSSRLDLRLAACDTRALQRIAVARGTVAATVCDGTWSVDAEVTVVVASILGKRGGGVCGLDPDTVGRVAESLITDEVSAGRVAEHEDAVGKIIVGFVIRDPSVADCEEDDPGDAVAVGRVILHAIVV